jgi:hypothetical protein
MRGAGRNLADGAGGMEIDDVEIAGLVDGRTLDLRGVLAGRCDAVTDEQGRRGHVATRHAAALQPGIGMNFDRRNDKLQVKCFTVVPVEGEICI